MLKRVHAKMSPICFQSFTIHLRSTTGFSAISMQEFNYLDGRLNFFLQDG